MALATVTLARVHALRSDLHMFTPWCVLASVAVFVTAASPAQLAEQLARLAAFAESPAAEEKRARLLEVP